MDLGKSQSISTDYRDRMAEPHWELRIFAEVVFVDKNSGPEPFIYQLKESAFPSFEHILHWQANALKLPNEAFYLLGAAAAFDKKNKQILLKNGTTVLYNYLVVGTNNTQKLTIEDQKFMDAFHALIEALRLQQKMPGYFHFILTNHADKKKYPLAMLQWNPQSDTAIEQVAKPYMCQFFDKKSLSDLHAINKRLYEVHI